MRPSTDRGFATALSVAQTPLIVSRMATACSWAMVLTPWVQNIQATGEVTAFLPNERQQTVDTPVGGRVLRWHVQEGSIVKAGDLLADVSDIDPEALVRLEGQKRELQSKIDA